MVLLFLSPSPALPLQQAAPLPQLRLRRKNPKQSPALLASARAHQDDAPAPSPSTASCTDLYLLDVSPLCYKGSKPSPSSLLFWLKSLLHVTQTQPVIAVMDGEKGNEFRRNLLPTYKANRNSFVPLSSSRKRQTWIGDDADLREAFPFIKDCMRECHIPIVSIEDAEADDVVASLTEKALMKGMHVKIASPDKDFKQLLCDKVQIVFPMADLERWSFYTHKDYFRQHDSHPDIELGLRCLLGDKIDNVIGLTDVVPGFGRKTALKLLIKHGSLENLLNVASKRTVGKPYVHEALVKYESILRKNLEVLRLRRDLPVCLEQEWCVQRHNLNDADAFEKLEKHINVLRAQRGLKYAMWTRGPGPSAQRNMRKSRSEI